VKYTDIKDDEDDEDEAEALVNHGSDDLSMYEVHPGDSVSTLTPK
jgi:hypothetical protein